MRTEVELSGRTAVVTGAGRGVFRAAALQLAAAGASVVVVDTGGAIDGSGNDASVADATVRSIMHAGGDAVACAASVTTPEGAAEIVQSAIDAFGRIDVLVNGAGIVRQGMLWEMSQEDFDSVLATHLYGAWHCMRAVLPGMIEQESGSIVNVSSSVGLLGRVASSNYVAAKAAVLGLTLSAALEAGPFGVRVNAVCPIGMSRLIGSEQAWMVRYPVAAGAEFPSERFPPEAVGPLVVYLAGDAAADVNGQVFEVGGGMIGWYGPLVPARRMEAERPPRFTVEEIARRMPTELLEGVENRAPRQEGPDRVWRR
jgi:NAD(P)-dependent dehydrogenase (short-subunit alcohol dehydrogenase family)